MNHDDEYLLTKKKFNIIENNKTEVLLPFNLASIFHTSKSIANVFIYFSKIILLNFK